MGVLKTSICQFSGLKIYPGRGVIFIRKDGQSFLFLNRKSRSFFHQRKRPAKIAWTVTYRKAQEAQVARKKRRSATRVQTRSITGASLEVLNKRRMEKPTERKASRDAALREVKERMKKQKSEKAASKAAETKKTGAKAPKQVQS